MSSLLIQEGAVLKDLAQVICLNIQDSSFSYPDLKPSHYLEDLRSTVGRLIYYIVPPEGLEPSTFALEGRCSDPLSYGGKCLSAQGGIRTHTTQILNLVPLPVGLQAQILERVTGVEPAKFLIGSQVPYHQATLAINYLLSNLSYKSIKCLP